MEAATARAPGRVAPGAAGINRLRSDRRLAERFRAGDDGAFAVLYERHRRRLHAICFGVLGSYEDAQDALQNALAAATASLREGTPDDVRAWLARVARNAAIDFGRARRSTDPLQDEPVLDAGPARRAQEREELEQLMASLRRLPERQRMALVMRELAGSSYGEIAEALEVDETAVRGLVARARVSLRAELAASELACAGVRDEIAHQADARRRSSIVRRHLRACDGCREFDRALRSDARALRGLAPSAGGLGLIGLASLLRVTRPIAVGGVVAKGALGSGAIQAVVACAVCLTAAEGVRELVIAPPADRSTPARSAADAGRTPAVSPAPAGAEASDNAPASLTGERRSDSRRRQAAARRRLRERHRAGPGPLEAERRDGAFGGRDGFRSPPADGQRSPGLRGDGDRLEPRGDQAAPSGEPRPEGAYGPGAESYSGAPDSQQAPTTDPWQPAPSQPLPEGSLPG